MNFYSDQTVSETVNDTGSPGFDSRTVVLSLRKNISFGGMDLKDMHTMHMVTLMYFLILWYIAVSYTHLTLPTIGCV